MSFYICIERSTQGSFIRESFEVKESKDADDDSKLYGPFSSITTAEGYCKRLSEIKELKKKLELEMKTNHFNRGRF